MPLTIAELKQYINDSGFMSDIDMREQVTETIWNGLELFRKYKKLKYYSHTGKETKKATAAHNPSIGRYDQKDARIILISAISRGWVLGTGQEPTLNNKKDYDSDFMSFASFILACEGVGHIHKHLEEYWSQRKNDWLQSDQIIKMATFRGE